MSPTRRCWSAVSLVTMETPQCGGAMAWVRTRPSQGPAGGGRRRRRTPLLLRCFPRPPRGPGFPVLALRGLGATLAPAGGRPVASANTRHTGTLLILLDQRVGFTSDFSSGNFNLDFPLGVAGS